MDLRFAVLWTTLLGSTLASGAARATPITYEITSNYQMVFDNGSFETIVTGSNFTVDTSPIGADTLISANITLVGGGYYDGLYNRPFSAGESPQDSDAYIIVNEVLPDGDTNEGIKISFDQPNFGGSLTTDSLYALRTVYDGQPTDYAYGVDNFAATSVPEPTSLMLILPLLGFLAFGNVVHRRLGSKALPPFDASGRQPRTHWSKTET